MYMYTLLACYHSCCINSSVSILSTIHRPPTGAASEDTQHRRSTNHRFDLFPFTCLLRHLKRLRFHDPGAFLDDNQLIGFDVLQGINLAAGPANLDQVGFVSLAQAEVDSQVAL